MNLGTHPPKAYQPDGGFELSGLGILIIGLSVAAILLGGVAQFVSRWFYLIILFPAGIGLLLGFVGNFIIEKARIRNLLIVGVFGLMAGVLAMGTMHYLSFLQFKSAFDGLTPEEREMGNATPEIREKTIQAVPKKEDQEDLKEFFRAFDAHKSFTGYLDFVAHQGVTLNRAHSGSDRGINLGYTGSYIYWIIETLIVAFIALFTVRDAARMPYCTRCHVWKIPAWGFAWWGDSMKAKTAAEGGNLSELGDEIVKGLDEGPSTMMGMAVHRCPKCQSMSTIDVFLNRYTFSKKGEKKEKLITALSYPGNSLTDFNTLGDTFTAAVKAKEDPKKI